MFITKKALREKIEEAIASASWKTTRQRRCGRMKLIDFLKLVPDTQEMWLSYETFVVQGKEESLGYMLGEDIYNGIVTDVEADDGVLKVWAKEDMQV